MNYNQTGTGMTTTGGQHSFAQVPQAQIQRSVFDRSCGLKTTFNAGLLIPIFVDEALPGDTMQMSVTAFGRISTLLHPIMDNLYLDMFFFAVPNRLLWSNWQKFNGEQTDPGDSTSFLLPQLTQPAGGFGEQTLGDYFGLPTQLATALPSVSALPFRAYNLIFNEWFRDQNLIDSLPENNGDGPDPANNYAIQYRGKRHDYFTSALPFAQKGAAVSLPLGTSAPVTGTPNWTGFAAGGDRQLLANNVNTNTSWSLPQSTTNVTPSIASGLTADLAAATAATINQLREAFQIQRLFERDARGGTRYTEILRSHFGVTSPDARLQRPEYLGGGKVMVNINPIASTNQGASSDLGDFGGVGTFGRTHVNWKQSFTEHCTIIGLCHLRADLNYQQGLERMWSRRTRFDFYWPALAHLGEQAILNKEIFTQGTAADDLTFGYQERYAEYRYKPSLVTGRFRSNSATPLDSWHLTQDFAALPVLNDSFIIDRTDTTLDRAIAVLSLGEPQVLADFFYNFKCARPMPVFSVPGLIDHF